MDSEFFFKELWKEFVISLKSRVNISEDKMKSIFQEDYEKALNLSSTRYFEKLSHEDKEWIRKELKTFKNLNKFKNEILKKAEKEKILIPFEKEWVVKPEKLKTEIEAVEWRIVNHASDKRTGYF